jgi:hypothetical protein
LGRGKITSPHIFIKSKVLRRSFNRIVRGTRSRDAGALGFDLVPHAAAVEMVVDEPMACMKA